MPTQIGKMALPFVSFSTTMGMLLTGSIINPRIFISTSICGPLSSLAAGHGLASQRIRAGTRDPNIQKFSNQCLVVLRTRVSGVVEVERPVLCGSPDPLTRGLIIPLHERFLRGPDQLRVAPDLDGPLLFLENHETPRFLFFRNLVVERQSARV